MLNKESLQFLTTQADRLSNTLYLLEQYYERMMQSNQEVLKVINESRAEIKILQREIYALMRQT